MGACSRHGPTPREQAMIDLRDRGLSYSEIADELGLKTSTVSNALGRLGGDGSDRAWNSMVRVGTEQLLEAIRRHHPERCA